MDNTTLLIILLLILIIFWGRLLRTGSLVVKAAPRGKQDPTSPELALVDALFPWAKTGSGRGFLGQWRWCSRCDGRGYIPKNPNVWQACPECYAGRFLVSDPEAHQPSLSEPLPRAKRNGPLAVIAKARSEAPVT
jgi:hypothetical protein